jgi:Flp pilus assembly protein TadG
MCRQSRTTHLFRRIRPGTFVLGERAAELVEVAFTLPILLTLLLGMLSFSRAYNAYQTITRAAREGARTLVLTTCATCGNTAVAAVTAQGIVDGVLQSSSLDPAAVSGYSATYVWVDATAATPQQCGVAVDFDYPYQLAIPFTSVNLANLTLKARVQMRLENQPTTCPAGTSVP